MDLIELGSQTAKNGFRNEDDIVYKFNNWIDDEDAKKWLKIMQYKLEEIEFVGAVKLHGHKTDVQVQVTIKLKKVIDVQNIQVKLVSNPNGFNQIDKRWVDKYIEMWELPKSVISILKRYTGEEKPNIRNPKDIRRMFADEFNENEQKKMLDWFSYNKSLVVSDILKGRGQFAAEWMLVVQKIESNAKWILKAMNYYINFFGSGDVHVTKRGNFKIGKITMQIKGGDGGRKTANMLQFKINPIQSFENKDE